MSSKNEVDDNDIREMLGLADKTKIIKLLKEILAGNSDNAIKMLEEFLIHGIDAKNFLNDILQILSLINRKLSLGRINDDKIVPEEEVNLINSVSEGISINDIGLFWQYTIKTIDDLRIINDEEIILKMYVLQLTHLKGIESNSINNSVSQISNKVETKILKDEEDIQENNLPKTKSQLKNTEQIKTKSIDQLSSKNQNKSSVNINSFEDIVSFAVNENEIELKYDLERNVKLVSFKRGKIDISFNEKLNKNFIKILSEKLHTWTGERWIISLNKKIGSKTIFEKKNEKKKNEISEANNNEKIKALLEVFDDANLIDVKKEDNS